jgi:DNA replication and repair protein RecF
MRIESLTAVAFRNLAAIDLQISAPVVVLEGANGQGKTNVLEALYLCATGRSFRHATAREMLRHGAAAGRCCAYLLRQGVHHEVTANLTTMHRQMRVDGRGLKQVTQLLELVNMVAFFPDDLRIAKGSPEERRRFLDRAVANSRPEFVAATLAYHRALKSRNALLKGTAPPDRALLGVYDEQLVRFGHVMHVCRSAVLDELLPVARGHFEAMMPGANLEVRLKSGVPEAQGAWETAFATALSQGYSRDRARGMTSSGPHRADLQFLVHGQDARVYASQGQQRSVVLALKLAEVVCLTARLGSPPILLLDDVSSELDPERSRRLFEVVRRVESQVWVSTTGAVPLPIAAPVQVFRVQAGAVAEASGRGLYGGSA